MAAKRARGRRVRYEHTEQAIFVGRVRGLHPDVVIAAVPNGVKTSRAGAVRLKAEGVLKGFPDLIIAEPRGIFCGLYIEMKRTEKSRTSKEQRDVLDRLAKKGYAVAVTYGADAAWRVWLAYYALGSHDSRAKRPLDLALLG